MGVVRVFLARRRQGAVICYSLLPPKARAIFTAIYLYKELLYIPISKI
jgi:replication initiation and membrane attachment protein DnaB